MAKRKTQIERTIEKLQSEIEAIHQRAQEEASAKQLAIDELRAQQAKVPTRRKKDEVTEAQRLA